MAWCLVKHRDRFNFIFPSHYRSFETSDEIIDWSLQRKDAPVLF